ncbi:LysR family transcriptional regulator [Francisella sp. LA112445]|uniref:LysR family transcriptional regulator n=1 Tax=Francisella sp. LA112445 TaxID=1395624 RepID=UPI001788DA26|nr:LysR family transcriptional regulator [Francisella sp. LA112445]QIW09921.1 LysR family transcriptional regulator [Francisella sp. LA112445]
MIKRNDLPPLNSLPVFVAVMKTKSYTKAAEQLFMTHSAVSQSIKKLETYFDKKLFLTQKRRLVITDLAKQYYSRIDPLITEIYQSTNLFKEQHINKISINCLATLCANWLIPRFDNIVEAFKDIDIQFITKGRRVDFDNDDIDLSIEYGSEEEFEGTNKQKLVDGELVLISNNKQAGKSFEEIISSQKLIFVDDQLRSNDYIHWCKHNNIAHTHNKKIALKNSIQAINACFSGVGYFVTEKLLIKDLIKNGLIYLPKQKSLPANKSYYLLSKEPNSKTFIKMNELLHSFLNE